MFQVYDVCLTVCLKLHTTQGCFCPQTFFRDTKLNMLSRNSLVYGLHYQLALSAGMFHALWLIVLVVFGAPVFGRFIPSSSVNLVEGEYFLVSVYVSYVYWYL